MRNFRSGPPFERPGIENQQKRCASLRVQHNRKDHALIFCGTVWRSHKDRLSGVTSFLVPCQNGPIPDINLHELIQKITLQPVAGSKNVAVEFCTLLAIVNPGKLYFFLRQRFGGNVIPADPDAITPQLAGRQIRPAP